MLFEFNGSFEFLRPEVYSIFAMVGDNFLFAGFFEVVFDFFYGCDVSVSDGGGAFW